MEGFLLEQLFFIAITFLLLIIPGWFFLCALFDRSQFTLIEKFVLSVPVSFSLITLSIIGINALGITLSKQNILLTLSVLISLFLIFTFFKKHKTSHSDSAIFIFSKKQTVLITLLIVFTIVIKTIFLINTVFPTATDLGHHMFWVEKITQEQTLPTYQKIEIDPQTNTFTEPEHIADFIVGEHIIFAVIKTFTNQSVISTFPSLVLFVVNIFTVLMIFILTRRLFARYRYGAHITILTLLFIGPLWAISGAQAKFVSGGVIGNLLGNLLIPAILYFFYRAFVSKKATLLIPAILLFTALAYTHHLSAFIFGYIFIFSLISFVILNRNGLTEYKKLFSLLKNPYIIPLLLIVFASLFILAPPSYLNKEAISTSVGAPSKSTRTGVPLTQLMYMLGEARFVLGFIGLFIITIFYTLRRFGSKRILNKSKKSTPTNTYGASFIIGWGWALLLMSLVPQLLQVNIISTRIATYGAFPLAILSGFAIMWLVDTFINHKQKTLTAPQFLVSTTLLLIFTFVFVSGLRDNATSLNAAPKTNKAIQTFHSGEYMSDKFNENLWLVKDHNYITSDTWLKVYFAYDYSYPLSRSYFKRYETNPNRETCTREMISAPRSDFAKECFQNLNVRAVLVNTENDASQFTSNDDFYRVYQNDELSLFIKR